MGPDVEDVMTEARLDGAASAVERRVRDAARDAWYDGINKGTPYHWRDVGPDEIWAAAWEAASNAEREACANACESPVPDLVYSRRPKDWRECAMLIRMRSNATSHRGAACGASGGLPG